MNADESNPANPWTCSWYVTQMCVKTYMEKGPYEAGDLLRRFPSMWPSIRKHAYLCYVICERQGNAKDARIYNLFIEKGWPAMIEAIRSMYAPAKPAQAELNLDTEEVR